MSRGVKWNETDDHFLKENYAKLSLSEISEKIGRTLNQVYQHIEFLIKRGVLKRLKEKKNIPFSNEELEILRKNYPDLGSKGCAKLLNRSLNCIRLKANRIGLVRTPGWKPGSLIPIEDLIDIKTPEGAYKLGLIWGDGCISKVKYNVSVTLIKSDFKDVENLFANWPVFEDAKKKVSTWKTTKMACVGHKKLHTFLKQNDYRIKSETSPYKILEKIPEHLRNYFFRGWSDADGYLGLGHLKGKRKCRVSISGSYGQDWGVLVDLATKYGIKYEVRRRIGKTGNNSYFSLFGEIGCRVFLNYIYDGKSMGLKRKYITYKNYIKNRNLDIKNRKLNPIGVIIYKGKKGGITYTVRIHKNKNIKLVGVSDIKEASIERDKYHYEIYKDLTRLNFPENYKQDYFFNLMGFDLFI